MAKLSELAEIKSGTNIGTKDYSNSGYKVLRAGDISSDNKIKVKEKKYTKIDRSPLKKGDILLVSAGSEIGYMAEFNMNKCIANQNLLVIRPNKPGLFKKLAKKREEIRNMASGAAIQRVYKKNISELEV